MNAYDAFACAYDSLNTEIDYDQMADFIAGKLLSAGIAEGALVLDLGCGTGTLTRLLADRGFDMIGVDASEEMLSRAREKNCEGILYLEQQLDDFELYGTVAAIVSTTDTLNHIIDPDELRRVFRLAHNYLDPGGMFVFDLNMPPKFDTVYHDRDYVLEDDGFFLAWQTAYDGEDRVADFYISLFRESPDGRWERADSEFSERCYDKSEIVSMLAECGFSLLSTGDGDSDDAADENTMRCVFTARCEKPFPD